MHPGQTGQKDSIMENIKLVPTEHNFNYQGFEFIVYKLVESKNGDMSKTTYTFNTFGEAKKKFNQCASTEKHALDTRLVYKGFNTENLCVVTAEKSEQIYESFGIYDYESESMAVQILLLENPTV